MERDSKVYVEVDGKMEERIYLEQNLDGTHKVVEKGFEEMHNAGLNVPTENFKEIY